MCIKKEEKSCFFFCSTLPLSLTVYVFLFCVCVFFFLSCFDKSVRSPTVGP